MDLDEDSSQDQEEGWDDFEEGECAESTDAQCLLSCVRLPSIEAAIQHDTQAHGFDFAKFRKQARLDDFETIMCINFIRSQVASGADPLPLLANAAAGGPRPWQNDSYMKPVLSDDAFLLHDWEDEVLMSERADEEPGPSNRVSHLQAQHDDSGRMDDLLKENATLRSTVQCLAQYLPDEVAPEVFEMLSDQGEGLAGAMSGLEVNRPSTSAAGTASPLIVQKQSSARKREIEAADAKYFDSYSHFGIHREMLSDKARTGAYQAAIERNLKLFEGATVLDVGCGTGILSLLAARAGAAHVIGVDGSRVMAGFARQICAANQLDRDSGGPVDVVAARIEEIQSLPSRQVDVIVSEWMGYTLLFETMLDTVLYARDRWLKPGGAILPDIATLYLAGAGPNALDTEFWSDVCGFSMEPIAENIRMRSQSKAVISEVAAAEILTECAIVRAFDLTTMKQDDADFSTSFELCAKSSKPEEASVLCHAMVIWFDTNFSQRFCAEHPVTLSTSPYKPQTHWAQTVLPLKIPLPLSKTGSGSAISGRISIARSKVHRSLDISLEYLVPGAVTSDRVASSYSIAMS